MQHDCPCKELVETETRLENIESTILSEIKYIKDKVSNINVMQNQVEMLREQVKEHLKDHKYNERTKSNRNWQLWFSLIMNAASILGFITYLVIKGQV